MKKLSWSVVLVLLAIAGFWLWRHRSQTASPVPTPPPAVVESKAPPSPATAAPGWPSGDALRTTLPADPGAVSLTRSLYRNGDVVLEQQWPDGSMERWWYPLEGQPHHIGRDGKETVGSRERRP